ncbi:MAG TPA: hypothetical protein VM529_12370 [Gemmata sp.]|nr:hypothetical protein [Gemmata sp.]
MTHDEIVAAISAAGHFPQLRDVDSWSESPAIETARSHNTNGHLVAPLIRTFKDRCGRWVLTVFGDYYCQVPNEANVPAATIAMLRAMDQCMEFSPEVIQQYNLVELDPSEFEMGDE